MHQSKQIASMNWFILSCIDSQMSTHPLEVFQNRQLSSKIAVSFESLPAIFRFQKWLPSNALTELIWHLMQNSRFSYDTKF